MKLYVDNASSILALSQLYRALSKLDVESYAVEVINVDTDPQLAKKAGIIATPTVVCESEDKLAVFVGDLADAIRLRQVLGIEPSPKR
jgi:hypothetical protein